MDRKRRRRQHSYWLDTLQELRIAKRMRSNTGDAHSPLNGTISAENENDGQQISDVNLVHSQADQLSYLRDGLSTRSAGDDEALRDGSINRVDDSIHAVFECNGSGSADHDLLSFNNTAIPDLGNNIGDTHMEIETCGPEHHSGIARGDRRHNELMEPLDQGTSGNVEVVPSLQESDDGITCTSSEQSSGQHNDVVDHPEQSNSRSVLPINSELSESCNPNFDKLQSLLTMWKSRLNLAAMIAIVGSVRFTVDHYEYSRNAILDAGSGVTWPSYSRTQRYFTNIVDSILPKSQLVHLPRKANTTIPKESHEPEMESDSERSSPVPDSNQRIDRRNRELDTEEVRVFLPSAWAKLDVSTSVVFDEMYPAFEGGEYNPSPLDRSEMVQNRDHITSSCDRIYVERNGRIVPASSCDEIKIEVTELVPSPATGYVIESSDDSYIITAPIVVSWIVVSDTPNGTETTHSNDRAMQKADLSPSERSVLMRLSTAPNPDESTLEDTQQVIPGDTCTLLRSQECSTSLFAVLIHRYWKQEDGLPSTLLIWIESEFREEGENSRDLCTSGVRYFHVVRRVSLTKFAVNHQGSTPSLNNEKPFGRLANGTLFVVYRILLYCDDFQKSTQSSKAGSAGGCYFLPLSMPVERRRNTSSVRIVSLTPPGVSTNDVLHFIVPDLVHAGTQGLDGYSPSGTKLRIFVDVLGFVGDYPASAAAIDVLGHVGRSPCTLCSFRRLQESTAEGSKFGYTTKVHSNNSSFLRHGERHETLRTSILSDRDANRLGMVPTHKYGDRQCPLSYLQKELESNKSRSALRDSGKPVLSGHFDAYRNNIIAADHLLTGLAKDILNSIFQTLPTTDLRKETDIRICAALRTNGLLPQKESFNENNDSLHSMTLSEIFCVLAVSVPVMRNVIRRCPCQHPIHDCFNLLQKLQSLVAYTYWWPEKELDGWVSINTVHMQKESYFSDLRKMSKSYVRTADEVCRICPQVKKNVDKPNLHRLIELYEHTIPAFGHVREVMELIFESAHQPLKRSINRKKGDRSHIFAVEQCVGNDWQGRLAALTRADLKDSKTARRGIRRLLLGEEADLLHEQKHADFTRTCDELLANLFTGSVRKQFNKSGMVSNFCALKDPYWKARTMINVEMLVSITQTEPTLLRRIIRLSRQWIKALYPSISHECETRDLALQLFKSARRLKMTSFGTQIGKPYGHDIVHTNCTVVVHINPEKTNRKIISSSAENSSTRPLFFAVVGILQQEGDLPWIICLKCTKRGKFLERRSPLSEDSFQLVRLTSDVRRVGIYHACDHERNETKACTVDLKRKVVVHSKSLLDGGLYFFQCRVQGYPPRMA